jgi:hypothetical protein
MQTENRENEIRYLHVIISNISTDMKVSAADAKFVEFRAHNFRYHLLSLLSEMKNVSGRIKTAYLH